MALGSNVHVRKVVHPRYKWLITFKDGERIRKKYFMRKVDAQAFKEAREAEAQEHGVGISLAPAERAAVVEYRDALQAAGLSLREALEFALARAGAMRASCTVAELAASFEAEKEAEGASRRYREDLRSRLKRIKADFGDRNAATIETQDVSDWLAGLGLSPQSVVNYRRVLSSLFAHGVKLGHCATNPVIGAMRPKSKPSPIGILTPEEAMMLLGGADAAIAPALAIGLFAGVRDAEIKRLEWGDIDLAGGYIEIATANAKSARSRLIPIRENLAAWLEPYAGKKGKVWPSNGRKLTEEAHLAAGFGKGETDAGKELRRWPNNALRHSYASYALAHEQDAAKLAVEMGHSDATIIFAHYRELVRPAEAVKFWAIQPGWPG